MTRKTKLLAAAYSRTLKEKREEKEKAGEGDVTMLPSYICTVRQLNTIILACERGGLPSKILL